MPQARRIGILTGGGDVPGLNSVIKSVVYNATEIGCEVIGIRRGWEGLTHMRPGPELDREYLIRLDRNNTRTIDRTGGTMLHTSRTNPSKTRTHRLPVHLPAGDAGRYQTSDDLYDLTPMVLDNISALGLDYLVTIGGDDTLSYSKVLDGHHPRQGRDQPPALDARLARADRRVPDLWPRRRVQRALHRVRDVGPVRHPGGAVRP